MPIKRDLFATHLLLKFYYDFSVSLVAIVPYAGTRFLTSDYLRAATTLVPISVSMVGRCPCDAPCRFWYQRTHWCGGTDGLVSVQGCAAGYANCWAKCSRARACSLSLGSYFPWCGVQFRKVRQGPHSLTSRQRLHSTRKGPSPGCVSSLPVGSRSTWCL